MSAARILPACVKACLLFSLLLYSNLSRAEVAAPETRKAVWRNEDAFARLQVRAQTDGSSLLHVPLPLELQNAVLGITAYQVEGGEIPAAIIRSAGRAVAVECQLLNLQVQDTEFPIEIYLSGTKMSDVLLPERKPVHVTRRLRQLRTRPFTYAEMLQLLTVMSDAATSVQLAAFEKQLLGPAWQQPGEKRSALLHWQSLVGFSQSESLQFGVGATDSAWFAFLDGVPLLSWQDSEVSTEGVRFGDAVVVSEGLHLLDFFVIQENDESLPVPMLYRHGELTALAPENCFSSRMPTAVRLQWQDNGITAGFALDEVRHWYLAELQSVLSGVQLSPYFAGTEKNDIAEIFVMGHLEASGEVIESYFSDSARLLLEQRFRASEKLPGALTWSQYLNWSDIEPLAVELRLQAWPTLLRAAAPLSLQLQQELPEQMLSETEWQLRWQQQNYFGTEVLASAQVSLHSGAAYHDVEIRLHDDVRRVYLQQECRSVPVSKPVTVDVLGPGASFGDLQVRARKLFVNSTPAVLRCQPLARFTAAGEVEAAAAEIVVVEDFWAGVSGPDADILPWQTLAHSGYPDFAWFSLAGSSASGATAELRVFADLAEILRRKADVVVWVIGQDALQAGLSADELCLQLLFLAQATHQAGALPVYFTLPRLPHVSAATSRRAALLTKQLGYQLGIPVIDAYSEAQLSVDGGAADFAQYFQSYDGSTTLRTPNNLGRSWLTQVLKKGLQYYGLLPAQEGGTPEHD